ncbi:MAG: hypothetical protein RIT43_1465 [Bacteroidota bacterium]|jgi:hypothetical protein
MKDFIVEATSHTPQIHFSGVEGTMQISGRSIPDHPDDFWLPVLSWFEAYILNPNQKTVVKINLEYFNISSSKRILLLMYKLNELVESGKEVHVEWYYRTSDEDMYEVGQDYAYMVKVPFVFKEFHDTDLLVAN